MITADKLQTLITFTPKALAHALASNGYSGHSFESAEFVGISNGGEFVYKVKFYDEAGTGEIETAKVYLTYHHAGNYVTADF
jgi:hypothetical protein